MDAKQHAWLARQLIDACGGPTAAAELCRVSKSRLGQYQDPLSEDFMPADVITTLEAYCGQPIYSAAMMRALPGYARGQDLLAEACATTESAAILQQLIRTAVAGKPVGAAARRQMMEDIQALGSHLAHLRAAVGESEP